MDATAKLIVAATLALVCSSGCGDSCEDALLALCEKGCECSTNGSCNVSLGDGSSVSGTDADACVESLKRFDDACGDGDDTDYDACLDDVDSAGCDTFGFGEVVAPTSCSPSS